MGFLSSIKRAFTSEPAPEQATPEQATPEQATPEGAAPERKRTYGRFHPGTREQVADLYRRGYPVTAIADYAGVTAARIYQVMKDEGVETRPRHRTAADKRRTAALPPLPKR